MRIEEIREAMGRRLWGRAVFYPDRSDFLELTGIFLAWYTSIQWHFIVAQASGPVIPTVIPAFRVFHPYSRIFYAGGSAYPEQDAESACPLIRQALQPDRFGVVIARRTTVSRSRNFLKSLGAERSVGFEE